VLKLVPTAPSRLVPLLAGGIPHRLHEREVQCLYMRGALALAEAPAAAAVREGILAAAVEHLLSLDVEIRWQDIVDDEGQRTPGRALGRMANESFLSLHTVTQEGLSLLSCWRRALDEHRYPVKGQPDARRDSFPRKMCQQGHGSRMLVGAV
jgi:hypothetical protein